ncbi:MAG: hypothetical protein WCO55_05685 [Candidatus Falkowbacteria bacterium]
MRHHHNSTKGPPKLGLDIHGVILDDGLLKSRIAELLYQIEIAPVDCTTQIVVREKKLLTLEQYTELQRYVYHIDFIGHQMPLLYGAKEFITRFARDFKLIVVTSNYGRSLKLSYEILQRHGLLQYLEIHHAGPGETKADVACHLGLDAYVDDDLHKLQTLIGLVPNLYLFGNNRELPDNYAHFATRIDSYYHLSQTLRSKFYGTREKSARFLAA